MLIKRPFWEQLIEKAWKQRTIIWLMGVRRVGKTRLCQTLPDVEYFDCELPNVRQLLEDPVAFLTSKKGKRAVLDEIHRLDNPSEILKIAADHYPEVSIIATGSSTLGASAKFKDTLTGRKKEVWLTPLLAQDLVDFGDWVDGYWAKDIQELFHLERRHAFQRFFELLMGQSGGIFEASRFTAPC